MSEHVAISNPADSPIFIVGNSRSGTTLVSNILKAHPLIYGFPELHFFEQMWTPDTALSLDWSKAIALGSRLIGTARESRLLLTDQEKYNSEAEEMLADLAGDEISHVNVYKKFLAYESGRNGKKIPCEQTPRYIFYLKEIFEIYPQAKVLIMVRDPRDIMLSQKNKWKQYTANKHGLHPRELLRAWSNYHPILLSQMWKRAMLAAEDFEYDVRVLSVRFEDLLQNPESVISNVCNFIDVPFYPEMLEVPGSRSSLMSDSKENIGISCAPIGRWKTMLSPTDIYWCAKIAGAQMSKLGFAEEMEGFKPNMLMVCLSAVALPVKAVIALLLNISQSRNIIGSIKRRLIG